MNVLTDEGKSNIINLLELFDSMSERTQYFMLGYMQSEADRNLQEGGGSNG